MHGGQAVPPGTSPAAPLPAEYSPIERPDVYLKAGDEVRVEIDKIGALENPVIAEPA